MQRDRAGARAFSVRIVAPALITGAGIALDFTVLDRSGTWLQVLVAVVALGVFPILAGWLAPRFFGAAFIGVMSFPLSTFLSLSVAFRVFGADTYDVEPFPFTIVLSAIYGGLASVAFIAGWTARMVCGRWRG